MNAADLLSHPTAHDLAHVRGALRARLDESLLRLGPEALDRDRIAAIFREVIHPRGGDDERRSAR